MVYVIIVYDVNVKRVNNIRKFLRQHLYWVQNSVFEGEISLSQLEAIKYGISKIINEKEDSVRIYILREERAVKTIEIGTPKVDLDSII